MTGAELIAQERQRQIEVEGWTPEHDDEHKDGALLSAAICYAIAAGVRGGTGVVLTMPPMTWVWPFDREWWKPGGSLIRMLVKTGALLAAEIDRLQRAEAASK